MGAGGAGGGAGSAGADGAGGERASGEPAAAADGGTGMLADGMDASSSTMAIDPNASCNGPACERLSFTRLAGRGVPSAIGLMPGGDVVVATGAADFDPAYVARLDPSEWTESFRVEWDDRFNPLALDVAADGNIYVAGCTQEVLVDTTVPGRDDAALVALDEAGGTRWIRQFGEAWLDLAGALTLDSDGAVVVGGSIGDEGVGPSQAFVARFDAGGTMMGALDTWGDEGRTSRVNALAALGDGAVLAAVRDPRTVVRIERDGRRAWSASLGRAEPDALSLRPAGGVFVAGYAATIDAEGRVYLAGEASSPLPDADGASGNVIATLDTAALP